MVLTSNKLRHYQRFLKEKFTELESAYYEHIDDLTQKLGDLELPGLDRKSIPDFCLSEFSFIAQWEDGRLSSADVMDIFDKMLGQGGYRTAARSKVIKPLQTYMMDVEALADIIKPVLAKLEADVVPVMEKYLELMGKAFKHMADIDARQIPVSWVEQVFDKGDVYCTAEDMSLNQIIRQLRTFISHHADAKYRVQDQIIIFDIIESMDERTIHYIFAPRCYIELLIALFEVKDELKGESEEKYLKDIILNQVS